MYQRPTRFAFFSLLLSLLSMLSSCGLNQVAHRTADNTDSMNDQMGTMTQNTEDMKKSTRDMKDDTASLKEQMGKMTESLEKVTTDMKKVSDSVTTVETKVEELGSDGRQAIGAGIRDSAWKAMVEGEFIERKLSQAAIYFSAIEFQTWKGTGLDTPERRDSLRFDAASEFLRAVSGLSLEHQYSLDVLSKDSSMNDLFAISALLHFVNPNQEIFAKKNGFKPESMLDIIENGMRKKKALEERKISIDAMTKADQEVQVWWDVSEYLIRLRANYLAAITTFKLARLEEARNGLDGKVRQARLILGPWNPELDYYSSLPGAVKEVTTYLQESTRARKFLREMNIDPRTDPKLKLAIKNIHLDPSLIDAFQMKLDKKSAISSDFIETLKDFKENI